MLESIIACRARSVGKRAVALLCLVWIAGWGIAPAAFGAPSAEVVYELEQPNGRGVAVINRGDEWNNRIETIEGYTIARGVDDYWYYVTDYVGEAPSLDAVLASDPPPRGLEKHIRQALPRPGSPASDEIAAEMLSAAPSGTFSGPVLFILTQFNDRAGSTTEAQWSSFITNNLADYYSKTSNGKVTLQPASETSGTANNGVVNWVGVGYNHPNTGSSTGQANRTLSRDAILAADASVDFSIFDGNADNIVDADELAVVVIVAGYERSYSSAYTPNVWGHKWSVGGSVSPPVVDGVTVGAYHSGAGGYAQFGELHRSSSSNQHIATMGIMAHELGHLIFGLPDLYDTDGSSSGIGAFGVMGGGSWGKKPSDIYSGATPVLASAWTRFDRGWASGVIGSGVVSITAAGSNSVTDVNSVFLATTPDVNQYFLVENRQSMGYDEGLERWLGSFGGIAIWHIDESRTNNTDDARRLVDLEEADGTLMGTGKGTSTDLWYAGNATLFNDSTVPDSIPYGGSSSDVQVKNISASAETMMAEFGDEVLPPPVPSFGLPGWAILVLSLLLAAAVLLTRRQRPA